MKKLPFYLTLALIAVYFFVNIFTLGNFGAAGSAFETKPYTKNDGTRVDDYATLSLPENWYITSIELNIGAIVEVYNKEGENKQYATLTVGTTTSPNTTSMPTANFGNYKLTGDKDNNNKDEFYCINTFTKITKDDIAVLTTSGMHIRISTKDKLLINEIAIYGYKSSDENKKTEIIVPVFTNNMKGQAWNAEAGKYEEIKDYKSSAENIINEQAKAEKDATKYTNFLESEETLAKSVNLLKHGLADNQIGNTLPLGKEILLIPALIFGFNTFSLRLMPLLASLLIIFIIYLFAKKLFENDIAAFIFTLLATLSCAFILPSKTVNVDIFAALFIILSFYFIYDYLLLVKNRRVNSFIPLILSGVFYALAVCVNVIYLPSVILIGLIYAYAVYNGIIRHKKLLENKKLTQEVYDRYLKDNTVKFPFITLGIYAACLFLILMISASFSYNTLWATYGGSLFSAAFESFKNSFGIFSFKSFNANKVAQITNLFLNQSPFTPVNAQGYKIKDIVNLTFIFAGIISIFYIIISQLVFGFKAEKNPEKYSKSKIKESDETERKTTMFFVLFFACLLSVFLLNREARVFDMFFIIISLAGFLMMAFAEINAALNKRVLTVSGYKISIGNIICGVITAGILVNFILVLVL